MKNSQSGLTSALGAVSLQPRTLRFRSAHWQRAEVLKQPRFFPAKRDSKGQAAASTPQVLALCLQLSETEGGGFSFLPSNSSACHSLFGKGTSGFPELESMYVS